jgi:exo-beta-1,3-glucanase (GH17 family)
MLATTLLAVLSLPFAHALYIPRAAPASSADAPTVKLYSASGSSTTGKVVLSASSKHPTNTTKGPRTDCYPALGFQQPDQDDLPSDTSDWWCPAEEEYAFVGFSYEVTACQSKSQLMKDFKDIRQTYNSRYIRLYGVCDIKGFYDDVIDAAWANTLGVHALVWFGFDGDDKWIARRDALFSTLHSNPLAPYVTRVVQFGSEPLFDSVLSPADLAAQVVAAKKKLSDVGINVTVSELAYGYQKSDGNAQNVLDALDSINIHMLPFFSASASTAKQAWPLVQKDLNWFIQHGKGKKMYFDENGWPSVTSEGVQPNSDDAVANVQNESDYYQLLDDHCKDLKAVVGGGVGWFAHIYSDNQEPGYGIYGYNGKPKFNFSPKTSC